MPRKQYPYTSCSAWSWASVVADLLPDPHTPVVVTLHNPVGATLQCPGQQQGILVPEERWVRTRIPVRKLEGQHRVWDFSLWDQDSHSLVWDCHSQGCCAQGSVHTREWCLLLLLQLPLLAHYLTSSAPFFFKSHQNLTKEILPPSDSWDNLVFLLWWWWCYSCIQLINLRRYA